MFVYVNQEHSQVGELFQITIDRGAGHITLRSVSVQGMVPFSVVNLSHPGTGTKHAVIIQQIENANCN